MPAVNFYLDKENFEAIQGETNRSALINELLREHFKKTKPLTQQLEENKEKMEIIAKEIEKIEEVKETQENQQKLEREKLSKEEEERRNSPEFQNRTELLQREAFERYEVPKERKEVYFKEYMEMLRYGEVKNLIEYADFKGFKKKVPRQATEEELAAEH